MGNPEEVFYFKKKKKRLRPRDRQPFFMFVTIYKLMILLPVF